nr:hypothetical protein [uncultured Pseudodesulfovibrio sp.]
MKYYLHVGLHKTATKFYQHSVFPHLPEEKYTYNPGLLTQLMADLLKASSGDVSLVLDAIAEEKQRLEKVGRDVVISREVMSGDLFSFYRDHTETISRLGKAFDDAEILLAFRYQPEWIISCYRESVHEHHYQSLANFISQSVTDDGFAHADYRIFDYTSILKTYCETFGKEHVHVSFFESFCEDQPQAIRDVCTILGLEKPLIIQRSSSIPNRGYSALAISLSIWRYKTLKALGLHKRCVHRPIFFFGKKGIPAGFKNLSVLPDEPYWGQRFLRDNEEVRSDSYPNVGFWEKVQMALSWRSLMKQGVDKITYVDSDLLKEQRAEIEVYFQEKNKAFDVYAREINVKIPKRYLG